MCVCVCVCVCYRSYFQCVHIETTDNIDFYGESGVYINYKVYGYNSCCEKRKKKNLNEADTALPVYMVDEQAGLVLNFT